MKVEIHIDCYAAQYIAGKANQFGDPREFARWVRDNFCSLGAEAVGETGSVYVWDDEGRHVATARDDSWSIGPGRQIIFRGRAVATLQRHDAPIVEVDYLAKRIVALLNKDEVVL